jgi:hypothetical protein
VADTWTPHNNRHPNRVRSRSRVSSRRDSRSPPCRPYRRTRSPFRQDSPRRERPKSPRGSSWRSGSPHRPRSPRLTPSRTLSRVFRDPSRTRYLSRSPKRDQLSPPPPQKYQRASPPQRHSSIRESESYSAFLGRSRSPNRHDAYRKHFREGIPRRRTASPSQRASSAHASTQGSGSTSRRSSPPPHPDGQLSMTPLEPRSRSPVHPSTFLQDESRSCVPLARVQAKSHVPVPASPAQNETKIPPFGRKEQTFTESRFSDSNARLRTGSPQFSPGILPSHEQQGPKGQLPGISGNLTPSQDITSLSAPSSGIASTVQSRGSSISLLSAPTRPRGGPSFNHRDPTWAGNPLIRRGTGPSGQHGPPIGPRSSFQTPSSHDSHRHSYRHNIGTPATYVRSQRAINHLSGLPAIVAGGKILPSILDHVTERRLVQLENDREKLLEQAAEKQQLKRFGLRDWERLDRESTTNALKSELAEGYLQRMAEGDSLGGSIAF